MRQRIRTKSAAFPRRRSNWEARPISRGPPARDRPWRSQRSLEVRPLPWSFAGLATKRVLRGMVVSTIHRCRKAPRPLGPWTCLRGPDSAPRVRIVCDFVFILAELVVRNRPRKGYTCGSANQKNWVQMYQSSMALNKRRFAQVRGFDDSRRPWTMGQLRKVYCVKIKKLSSTLIAFKRGMVRDLETNEASAPGGSARRARF